VLTIRAVSIFNECTFLSSIPDIDFYGIHRFDNLVPGTLYEIAVRRCQSTTLAAPTVVPLAPLTIAEEDGPPLFITTDPMESMFLDAANLSPYLKLSNGGLTVRNTAPKKWSTVRSTMKFVSGINTWSVRIDRCVSKNIFIGIVTESAKMDNYVGCDKRGWAFLANKAIWHNKCKVKAYGELFRKGSLLQ
jgi:hypothetical protein